MNKVFPWSCDTNWLVVDGSITESVTVESSDDPIDESVSGNPALKAPLVLKAPAPDSGPCEIKICFEKKYEVGQVYVRSTARTYEIYWTHSAHSINEYLCTVRCGVAERDDKVLQTNYIEDVAAESATDGGNVASGEEDWINIKAPEEGRCSASDKIITNASNNIQDFYEATAQISDSEPCLSLTIRLLSLQEKGHVYVDEIYVFVDTVESTDSGNVAVVAGSSAQTSLMPMFMPTLLQLSKSGMNRVEEKCKPDEVLKDAKMETGSIIIDEIDRHQQYVKPKELDKNAAESSELKDTVESSEIQQHTSAEKSVEPKIVNDPSPGRLETAFEQLISRMSRVEEICLRFEEKMLKPIESMEVRLQRVEDQLEKLTKNSHNSGLPNCTRISAPAFSCSESNSSSLYDELNDYANLEKKDFSCDNMPARDANFHPGLVVSAPEFSCGEGEEDNDVLNPLKDSPCVKPKKTLSLAEALAASLDGFLSTAASNPSEHNFHPGLVVSAPEFSCGEGEEDNDVLNPLKDSPCVKPKKTLSLAEALAASLDGFLSTAASNPSEHIQTSSGLSSKLNAENQDVGHAESCQVTDEESPDADNSNTESSQYAQVLTVKAPDFTSEEEEQLNYIPSCVDTVVVTGNEKDDSNQVITSSTQSKPADSCGLGIKESTDDIGSASNGDSPVFPIKVRGTCLGKSEGNINGISEVKMIESYFEGDTNSGSAPDLAMENQISDDTNLVAKSTRSNADDHQDDAAKQVLGHESENVSGVLEQYVASRRCFKNNTPNVSETSAAASLLDLEFPILEVKFASDTYTSTKSPLEALLGGAAVPDTEAPPSNATGDSDVNAERIDDVVTNGNGTTDAMPINLHPLVDVGGSSADGCLNLEGTSHNLCTPSTLELNASLI